MKYSKNRPDVQTAIEEVLEEDEIDYVKEEMIASHLDICLLNDNMLNFPIQKLIRILNSPKRVLNDHKLLFEFIKKIIFKQEKEKEEENIQLLMSSLDYSQMSTKELKELFNSKYYSNSVNMRGTKEQMKRFMSEIEKQEEKINSLIEQMKKQEQKFNKYEEEYRRHQQSFASYESKMKEIEDTIKHKFEKEHEKLHQNYEEQLTKIKELEEKIENENKEELNSQATRIQKLEEKIRFFVENSLICQLKMSVEHVQTIKGVIDINEKYGKLNTSRSKYLLNTSSARTLGLSSYDSGQPIDKLKEELSFVMPAGTYYLHCLLTDNFGHSKEFVSESVTIKSIYNYEFTGKVEMVTLPSGRYKLEVWGAEGGKDRNHSRSFWKRRLLLWNPYFKRANEPSRSRW